MTKRAWFRAAVLAAGVLVVTAAVVPQARVIFAMPGASSPAAVPPEAAGEQFTIAVYETPDEFALRTDTTAKGAAYWKAWGGFHQSLTQAGTLTGGMPLQPRDRVKCVRLRDGKPKVEDGPFARSEPELSGYFMIRVDNMEAALAWAAKVPNANTSVVEVWPAFPQTMPIPAPK